MNIEIEENNLIKKLESANILSQYPVVSREPQAAGWHINKCLCHKRKGRLLEVNKDRDHPVGLNV